MDCVLRLWLRCFIGIASELQLLPILLPIWYRMRKLRGLPHFDIRRDILFPMNLNPILIEHQGLDVGSFWIIRGFLRAEIMILR